MRSGRLPGLPPRGEGGSDGSQPAAEPLQGGAGHRSTLRSCGYVPSVRRTKGRRTRGAPLTRAPTPSSAKPPVEPRGGAAARGRARVVLGNWGARGVAGPKGGAVDASRERGPLQLFTASRGPSANQGPEGPGLGGQLLWGLELSGAPERQGAETVDTANGLTQPPLALLGEPMAQCSPGEPMSGQGPSQSSGLPSRVVPDLMVPQCRRLVWWCWWRPMSHSSTHRSAAQPLVLLLPLLREEGAAVLRPPT